MFCTLLSLNLACSLALREEKQLLFFHYPMFSLFSSFLPFLLFNFFTGFSAWRTSQPNSQGRPWTAWMSLVLHRWFCRIRANDVLRRDRMSDCWYVQHSMSGWHDYLHVFRFSCVCGLFLLETIRFLTSHAVARYVRLLTPLTSLTGSTALCLAQLASFARSIYRLTSLTPLWDSLHWKRI